MYLISNKVFCLVGNKNGTKYLKIDKGELFNKWDQVLNGIKYHIEKISSEKVYFDSGFDKIRFVTDDLLPLGKLIYFPTLSVVIR